LLLSFTRRGLRAPEVAGEAPSLFSSLTRRGLDAPGAAGEVGGSDVDVDAEGVVGADLGVAVRDDVDADVGGDAGGALGGSCSVIGKSKKTTGQSCGKTPILLHS
jgi:hypothetical protein